MSWLIFVLYAVTQNAFACSCVSWDAYLPANSTLVQELFSTPKLTIVHGKTKQASYGGQIELVTIRHFYGVRLDKIAPAYGPPCGTSFDANEEKIFIATDGVVSMCGKMPPTAKHLRAMEKHVRKYERAVERKSSLVPNE